MPKSSRNKHETRRANRDRRQRLEELRQQQKSAERRKNFLFAGSAVVVALVLIGAAVIPAWLHDRDEKKKSQPGYQATPTAAEKAAGCDGVHNDPVSPPGTHVPNTEVAYADEKYGDTRDGTPAIPPSGGKHNPVTLGTTNTRFYAVSVGARPERAVHNLEHGQIVAWFDDQLPKEDVDKLEKLTQDPTLAELIAVGWQGELPAGKHFVLTSWGRTDRCASVSDAVVRDFYQDHVNSELAPEAGSGATGGDSFPPDTVNTQGGMTPAPQTSATATVPTKKEK